MALASEEQPTDAIETVASAAAVVVEVDEELPPPTNDKIDMEVDDMGIDVPTVDDLIGMRFPEIAEFRVKQIKEQLHQRASKEIVMDRYSFAITHEKLVCLRTGCWLNDEVCRLFCRLFIPYTNSCSCGCLANQFLHAYAPVPRRGSL